MRKRVNDFSLKKKFMLILVGALCFLSTIFLILVERVTSEYNSTLYHSVYNAMSYSAQEIGSYLDKAEAATENILSDETIQESLSEIKEGGQAAPLNRLGSRLGNYGIQYQDGIIQYLTLYTCSRPLKTDLRKADRVPADIQDRILAISAEKDGAVALVDQYMDEYGLFVVRDIRRIEAIRLDRIGTILVNIDIDAMAQSSYLAGGEYGQGDFAICRDGEILYQTEGSGLGGDALADIDDYGIIHENGLEYFVVHYYISKCSWDYYYMVPYDAIGRNIRHAGILMLTALAVVLAVVIGISFSLVDRSLILMSDLQGRILQFSKDNTKIPLSRFDYSERNDEIGQLCRQFDSMSSTIAKLIQKNYTNEILKKAAQLKALENQINPHFLYNTLNTIDWKAKSNGESEISEMTEALGTLLRTSLSMESGTTHTLGKEISIINAYMTIQKFRYSSMLHFSDTIDEALYNIQVPIMSVQPLVDNAVNYGLDGAIGTCEVALSASINNGTAHIFVRNTGSEFDDNAQEMLEQGKIGGHGNGVGLANINQRVRLQYGVAYGLRLYNEDAGEEDNAVAELVIPAEK